MILVVQPVSNSMRVLLVPTFLSWWGRSLGCSLTGSRTLAQGGMNLCWGRVILSLLLVTLGFGRFGLVSWYFSLSLE